MPLIARAATADEESARFAAWTTSAQFSSLAARLQPGVVIADTEAAVRQRPLRAAQGCDRRLVSQWLVNGWSTEQLLELNRTALGGDSLRHSLHWAFPQAYYSVFAVTLAYFKSVGHTEESHAAVIKKFGHDVVAGRYPSALCFAAVGAKPCEFVGLGQPPDEGQQAAPVDARLDDDEQLAQFLRATRNLDLRTRKASVPVKTKSGHRRKAFRPQDWKSVSDSLGPTSLLSLLYRKRIKANYRDIDTFLHPELRPDSLYQDLLRVVGACNFVHEVMIAKALGLDFIRQELGRIPNGVRGRVEARRAEIERLAG